MRALHIKLLRNLWSLKGQMLAIAAVIATGVAMYVMSFTALESLYLSQQSVYRNQYFADVFASLKRAPESLAKQLREIPGVGLLETRVQAPLRLDLESFGEPITGLALSIPDGRQPQLNRLFLRAGSLPDPERDDQLLVSEAFAEAHHLKPGDAISLVINGRYQRLVISGMALSPEFIYQIRPGDIFPDFARYAIVWMNRRSLETAFGMEGAFNSLSLKLAPGARAQPVIERLDQLLAPWGGLGGYGRAEQLSHRYLSQEMAQIKNMAVFLPLIFIGVAAFLLNMVTARLIRTQREQIAVLKAFGYSRWAVAGHYLALVALVIALGGLAGIALGAWMAHGMALMYQEFFRFPWLEFRLRPGVAAAALFYAGGATLLGTLSAVRAALRLPPAEAMRPEPPASYSHSPLEAWVGRRLSQPSRIILRNLTRQPLKAGLSLLGIALAVAVMMLTGFQKDAINYMMDVQFRLAQRQDMTLGFYEAAGGRALNELSAMPGVYQAEGFRTVSAVLRYGQHEYRAALQGYDPQGRLFSVLNRQLQPVELPVEGVLLTDYLAQLLGIKVGETLQVEVKEGRRPLLEVPVAGLVTEFIGVGAYMRRETLNRLLREPDNISGAFLAVAAADIPALERRLQAVPRVAGVSLRSNTIKAFNQTMEESLLVFTLFASAMAGAIAFAVVYNNARIAFAERSRELASLRVLGFRRAEVAYILLGELLLLSLLALPLGFVLGAGLCHLLALAMATDLYRIPLVLELPTYTLAAGVVLLATLVSALIMARYLARLDMVSALKAAE